MLTVSLIVAAVFLILGFAITARMYVTNPIHMMFFGQAQFKMLTDALAAVLAALADASSN